MTLYGKSWVTGITTVTAPDAQVAKEKAMRSYEAEGVEWRYAETDEEHAVEVIDVEEV